MFLLNIKKGFFFLSALLMLWGASAQAAAMTEAAQQASAVAAHHAEATASGMQAREAHRAGVVAHDAGSVCDDHSCASGCAAACGHATAAVDFDPADDSSCDAPAIACAQSVPTEAYRDALLRPPRLLHLS